MSRIVIIVAFAILFNTSLERVVAESAALYYSEDYPFEGDSIILWCLYVNAPTWANVSHLAIYDETSTSSTTYYELARNCTTGQTQVVHDSLQGRMQPQSAAAGRLTWVNISTSDSSKRYSCAITTCQSEQPVHSYSFLDLNVLPALRSPLWLTPTEATIEAFENVPKRIVLDCQAELLHANETVQLCVTYVSNSGAESSCKSSSETYGNQTVSTQLLEAFARTASYSTFFNCFMENKSNKKHPFYAAGRNLIVHYATDEFFFTFNSSAPDFRARLKKVSKTEYTLGVAYAEPISYDISCDANGSPAPLIATVNVLGLHSSQFTVQASTVSITRLEYESNRQFTVVCEASYFYENDLRPVHKNLTGNFRVQYSVMLISTSTVPATTSAAISNRHYTFLFLFICVLFLKLIK